jgi:hypothetical protein
MFMALIMSSASCDKGSEGCIDFKACNFDVNAAIDDNSCWYASSGCDCDDQKGSEADCLGVCDNNIDNDPADDDYDGICNDDVIGGCIDSLKCNFNLNATHNDGSCAPDLFNYGGSIDGNDCTYPGNGSCGGSAAIDNCDLCIGGLSNYGECWQIKIQLIATFVLQSGFSMGSDTSSIIIGASHNATDTLDSQVYNGSENCQLNYSDSQGLIKTEMNANKKNFINFHIPHDGDPGWNNSFGTSFNRDIRSNDYQSLFDKDRGMNWFSLIEPTMQDTLIMDENGIINSHQSILDSIKLDISFLEGLKCTDLKMYFDRIRGEYDGGEEFLLEDNKFKMKVDTDKSFSIMFNVSNICIQEFEESCPDGYSSDQ